MISTRSLVPFALLVGGCFDSLVSDPCKAGYSYQSGACVARNTDPDAGPGRDAGDGGGGRDAGDAGSNTNPDGGPVVDAGGGADALVCTLPDLDCNGICIDVTSDPNNCGACGHVCASGICQNSQCVGDQPGHIVAIGHDYVLHHPAMVRVLGNAASLAIPKDIGVAFYRGTATTGSANATTASLANALLTIGRPWHAVPLGDTGSLTGVDVLVVDAQTGDGNVAQAAGASWKPAIDTLLARSGVVVVLEGASGVSYRFAAGAGLYTVGAPVDATNQLALVVDPSDALANQVVSPYLAEMTSVTQPGAPPPVVTTPMGGTIVFHTTR